MNAAAEALTQEATQLLRALVGFASVSSDSNLPLIAFIRQYLEKHGIHCAAICSPDGGKSNLLARIGPQAPGGVVLSGHTDVVPVAGQQWDSEPFTLSERHGKLYGRGTADMKSFLACVLAVAPMLQRAKLEKPVYLAFSHDEEVGCLGVPRLLDYVKQQKLRPDFALIGEPTEMKVVTTHKGMLSFETVVTGKEWHSSQPQRGVNAVQIACELVCFLNHMAEELREKGLRDARFDPPCSTIHIGTIQGGTARNIVPKQCRFLWEIRPLPGEDTDALLARLETYCKERMRVNGATITHMAGTKVGAVALPAGAATFRQQVMQAARTNRENAVSFFTEGGVFQHYEIPAIVCGPGSIAQAHQPNEFIEKSQIGLCIEFLLRLTLPPRAPIS